MDVALPDAGFYLWAKVPCPGHDTEFARALLAQYNVTVLPGSYLAREAQGSNPGRRSVSAWPWWPKPPNAWKPALRIVQFIQSQILTSMTQQLQTLIDAAWDNRANLSAASAPRKSPTPSTM
jgi:hypothetical protein